MSFFSDESQQEFFDNLMYASSVKSTNSVSSISQSPVPTSLSGTPQRSNTPIDSKYSNPVLPRLNPMVESTGVMTKHTLIMDQEEVPFEMKLNITDSELVVVENSAVWDTSAVILKVSLYKNNYMMNF